VCTSTPVVRRRGISPHVSLCEILKSRLHASVTLTAIKNARSYSLLWENKVMVLCVVCVSAVLKLNLTKKQAVGLITPASLLKIYSL
jgi:hypothetical protein